MQHSFCNFDFDVSVLSAAKRSGPRSARAILERLNREIARRTRVAALFQNEDALLRPATAVFGEIDEDWATGKICLCMKH